MNTAIRLALTALVVILLLGLGAWYYLFGPNKVAAADLLPSNTVAFATIPNAARLVADYQTSQLKRLVDTPESQPIRDSLTQVVGSKNFELLQALAPDLSGQSFLAVTHYDPADPAHAGLIAGLKPKPGAGNFNDFVAKVKAAYPDLFAQATTGAGQVEGLDYQWIRGPAAADKICVAQTSGWIITAWGEDSLRDWWERFQKKSTTPSLSQNPSYIKSLKRIGPDSETLLYLDSQSALGFLQGIALSHLGSAPASAPSLASLGPLAIGTKFAHGEIEDHYSLLLPRSAQLAVGFLPAPAPLDTLKFTGPDTRFYWGAGFDFAQLGHDFQPLTSSPNFVLSPWITYLTGWAQSHNLDLQRNIFGPLGHEASLQIEWGADASYPEAGFVVKVDKPDDFKPTIAAIIDTARQVFSTSAVINEIESGDQKFASLQFVQSLPINPTITENGPYFGLFLTANQAVRSFKRDANIGLTANDDFKNNFGDRTKDASQLIYFDSPQLLNRGYQTVLPYVSLAAMFNRTLGSLIAGRNLPPDLQWLAPIGTWSCSASSDDDGLTAYSISGIGNQGILLAGGTGAGLAAMGFLNPPAPSPMIIPTVTPSVPPINSPTPPIPLSPNPSTAPEPPPAAPSAPAAVPPVATNASPDAPEPATNH